MMIWVGFSKNFVEEGMMMPGETGSSREVGWRLGDSIVVLSIPSPGDKLIPVQRILVDEASENHIGGGEQNQRNPHLASSTARSEKQ